MTQNQKPWQVIDVVNHDKADSPIDGESEFVTIRLKPKREKKTLTAEVPMSKTFFKSQNPDLWEDLAEGYDFENKKVTDRDKLKEIEAVGHQSTIKVDLFFVMDRKGNFIYYPKGDPDAGKPRVRDTRTVLVLEGETEDDIRDMINTLNARNGSKVNIEKTDVNLSEYHNEKVTKILKDTSKGDAAGDGETLDGN